MKLLADEHVSTRLVAALKHVLWGGIDLAHVKDRHGPGTPDEAWLSAWINDGGDAVLSGDRRFMTRAATVERIRRARIAAFALEPPWQKWPLHRQAALILAHWDSVLDQIQAGGGSTWKVPSKLTVRPLVEVRPRRKQG